MAFNKENVTFVYRQGDSDSRDVALEYASVHDLDTVPVIVDPGGDFTIEGQLLGVNCSETEILPSEATFNTQVLTPIQNALTTAPLSNYTIWGIVLGYRVPGGFYDGDDIISSTSRISRINHAFSKKTNSTLYNKANWRRYNDHDAEVALITSRIDAPTSLIAIEYIKNAASLKARYLTDGTFYLDIYSDKIGTSADEYQDKLTSFSNLGINSLNLDTWSTIYLDPYIDVVIPYVTDDSYVWSWFTDRSSATFFQSSEKVRAFFYNADYDGAYTIRDINGRRWCYLAMNAGYVCTAGSLSNPTIDSFLDPNPFFLTLYRRGTMGEAYLFSLPYFDWTVTLFGDPLAEVSFPDVYYEESTDITEDESWRRMSIDIAESLSYLQRKATQLENARQTIIDSIDVDLETMTLYKMNDLYNANTKGAANASLKGLIDAFFQYPEDRFKYTGLTNANPTTNNYLTQKSIKVSQILTDLYPDSKFSSSNELDQGWWMFEFYLEDKASAYALYHFQLKISSTNDFEDVVMEINSWDNATNWYYEKETNVFEALPDAGIASNYVGRRMRYQSDIGEYLTRQNIYCVSIAQYNTLNGTLYPPEYNSMFIYT